MPVSYDTLVAPRAGVLFTNQQLFKVQITRHFTVVWKIAARLKKGAPAGRNHLRRQHATVC